VTETGPIGIPDFLFVVSQRGAEQRLLVHCRCGAPIETCGKKETCRECGATVEVVRRVPTPHGEKYRLRVNKRPWKSEPPLFPLVLNSTTSNRPMWQPHEARPAWRHFEPSDHSKGFLDLGALILLALFCFIFFCIVSAPRTTERAHHYEKGRDVHVSDGRGVYTLHTWNRIDD
jgi:hypothetical protein